MEIYIIILVVIIAGIIGYEFFSKIKLIKELNEKNKDLELKTQELYAQLNEAEKEKVKAEAENKLQKQTQEQQKIIFDNMQKIAEGKFKEIASNLLTQKTEELQNKGIEPLSKNLNYLQEKLATMEHLNENLQKEASNLANALKNNKKQGDFGEMLLEQLLESCGLKEGVHYTKQNDFIINMPDNRYLVVDCKMVLTAYNNYVNEKDPVKSKQFLAEHIKALKNQIEELSKKKYQELKEIYKHTPDFVIMYVPIEMAYLCALEYQKDLGIFASGKKVMVATASSLIPILKTIEQLWNIYLAQKHTEEILKIGRILHEKVSSFSTNMGQVKGSLNAALNHYEDARRTFDGKGGILSQVKKLEELGAKSSKQLPEIDFEEEK